MSLVWLIYFASIVDGIGTLFTFIAFIGGIVCTAFTFFLCHLLAENEPEKERLVIISLLKKFSIITVILAIIANLIPNERQVYLMTAAYVGTTTIQNISESPEFQKARTILQHKMDEYIKENDLDKKQSETEGK